MIRRPPHPCVADSCPVTVIIKALNEQGRIASAVETALAGVAVVGGEVVLADSGSTDRTVEIASAYPIRIVQLADPRERSCGIGAQLGFQHSRGEFVYLMDGDMSLETAFLGQALAFLAQHPEVAGVGGRVVERNLDSLEYRERQSREAGEPHRAPGPVDRLDGGALYRRLAIQDVGYLSDRNLHSYEELDLGARLRSRGWKLWRLPDVSVSHEGHRLPALRLLWRRWVSGYAWGPGELLRAALGQPWLGLVLRDARALRLYAGVWGWWLALASVSWLPQPLVGSRAGTVLALALAPALAMAARKRSLARGTHAVLSWCVCAAGLARGLLRQRRPPQHRIASRILREPHGAVPPSQADPQTIFIACPWTPAGGGMFKVADYLMQSQAALPSPRAGAIATDRLARAARLLPLDTRGDGSAAASLVVLGRALARLAHEHRAGRVAGVHVNMAERLSLLRKGVVVLACRMMAIPVVLHLHAAQLHRAWPGFAGPLRWMVRQVFRLPAACIVLGRQSADFVVHELKVPRERVEIVINGVPAPQAAGPRRAGPPRLLFVGNLSCRKGVPELLRALALPPLSSLQAELTLVGRGDLPHWRALAGELGLGQRAHFEGWADQPRVGQLLSQSDALVLPSHDEGLPLAILEALAHGVPVVCSPVGEISQVLADGRDACFVPAGDAAALARVLARLLGDARLREALSRNGRALWREHFTLARFFERIAAIHHRHFGVSAAPAASGQAVRTPAPRHGESAG